MTWLASLAQKLPRNGQHLRRAMARGGVLAFAMVLGGLGALAAVETGFAGELKSKLGQWRTALAPRGNPHSAAVATSTLTTAFHVLRIERLPVGRAWSLASIGDDIVFSSRMGQLAYVTPRGEVRDLGLTAPMGVDALRRSGLTENLLFEIVKFRVTDVLAIETAPGRHDLFVAHHRYEPSGCFRLVVSRVRLRSESGSIASEGGWDQVFQTRDCVAPKQGGALFAGEQSGGRLIQLDAGHIALATGDFELDGVHAPERASQDMQSDLGKLIEINLGTGATRILALGLRNPQGLAVTRAGLLWETEHGPQGGDELNLIPRTRGAPANLGWPLVTYGMRYAQTPTTWPLSDIGANHDGYLRPRYALVPSVGISNLVEPDSHAFPNWDRHLLIASLRANTLFLARLEGEQVAYVEPIVITGSRLRDIISLADGRLALATDAGAILIVSNAERGDAREMHVTGLTRLSALVPEESEEGDSELRRQALAYSWHCQQCHSLSGAAGIGPPLNDVIGRAVGGAPNYAYSEALSDQSSRWTAGRLRRFLNDPSAMHPGTTMPRPEASDESLDRIVAFLRSREATTRARARSSQSQVVR